LPPRLICGKAPEHRTEAKGAKCNLVQAQPPYFRGEKSGKGVGLTDKNQGGLADGYRGRSLVLATKREETSKERGISGKLKLAAVRRGQAGGNFS